MKTYFTFGQDHSHPSLDVDKDTVLVVEAESEEIARDWFFECHGSKFCFTYTESPDMSYFPKGYRYASVS